LNIKLKGCHFDTIEVVEAESQAVLNTFTEHDLQDTCKKLAEALGMVYTRGKGTTSRVMVAAKVPEITDGSCMGGGGIAAAFLTSTVGGGEWSA
jgi:hypothetical protein